MSQPIGPSVGEWVPPGPPSTEPMVGRYVTVSALQSSDAAALWKTFAEDGDDTWTYMGYGPFSQESEVQALLDSWVGLDDPLFVAFRIDDTAVGWGAYLRITPAAGSVEVGHLAFGPDLRRSTAATEAMYLMARRAFDSGYRRYEWKCDALNARSRAAAERLGFTYEGTFRQHMIYKGRNRDTAWYSITDQEWPERRRRFEEWLDPANFDQDGRQLRPL